MQQLELLGIHSDQQQLVLTDEFGARYCLPIDDQLRALVKTQDTNSGPRTAKSLSPKTIQSLYRAGLTPAEVAATHEVPVSEVERYESAVLAERSFVAQKARSTPIGEDSATLLLGDLVVDRLATRSVSAADISWDATRAQGEPWQVTVTFNQAAQTHRATWRFDPRSRSLKAMDDEARWLTEGTQDAAGEPGPAPSGAEVRTLDPTRSSAQGATVSEAPSPRMLSLLERLSASRGKREEIQIESEADLEKNEDELDTLLSPPRHDFSIHEGGEPEFDNPGSDADTLPGFETEPETKSKPVRKGRRSVPAWDEIMFGAKSD